MSMYINENVINKMQETLKLAGDATRLKILFCLLDESDKAPSFKEHYIEKCVNGGLNPTKISIYIPNIKEEFNKLTDINKLYACSYGGINECKKKETFDKKDKMFEWLNKYVF